MRLFLFSLLCAWSFTVASSLKTNLELCLRNTWGVDQHTTKYIISKFMPLLEDRAFNHIIDDFIIKSHTIAPNFLTPKIPSQLHNDDGIIQAPEQHLIVFENPWVRILLGSTQPGVCENVHMHAWKSILVIIRPTTFKIVYADGAIAEEYYPIGVYELPAMEKYSCTNIGDAADECLRFEVKV